LAASSSGDGAITYAVQSAGATGCTINSSTRVLTFTAAGSCVIRATAATTSNYLTGYIDATFTVTLAAPAFSLSSTTESKAQNTAIAGYTITSTGGAIASYAISPSAPTGLTFSTSTGLLSGTPTTVQSATAYTITATNTTSTATRTFTLTVTAAATCATGGACIVGNTGPGGGKVFYVSSSNFTSTGSNCGTACKYLEAAPSDHSSQVAWCSNITSSLDVTASDIGSGMSNTTTADSTCTSGAIQVAADYTYNSKTDWHLPSKDELAQLYIQSATVGGFSTDRYWSSTEYFADRPWYQYFYNGGWHNSSKKDVTYYVRPVRAFG
jgi:hypothetical protein